mmetsp:Transcript_29662/g.39433  ORF Transcript_29662/g.39433 Transcript_29662/m.39433 type:complete len:171 (+) Transcript_29662:1750-2262(+)
MLLKDVIIAKAERTEDILSQMSEQQRAEFASKLAQSGSKVYSLLNANNRGYCRVLMSTDELRFFGSVLDKLNTVNRCYMWRILFDHVKMGSLKIDDFWQVLLAKFRAETNEEVVLLLLDKIHWLLHSGFIDADLMTTEEVAQNGAKLGPLVSGILLEKVFDPSTHSSLKT